MKACSPEEKHDILAKGWLLGVCVVALVAFGFSLLLTAPSLVSTLFGTVAAGAFYIARYGTPQTRRALVGWVPWF